MKKMCVFACSGFYKFANISSEMKKILIFVFSVCVCMCNAGAAVRGENTATRGQKTTARNSTQTQKNTVTRNAVKTTVSARATKPISVLTSDGNSKSVSNRKNATRTTTTARTGKQNVVARAATSSETNIGEAYERCKTAFFTCMDQFCTLKNDNFRRCSCSDKIYDYQELSESYQKANERLTEFSEDLDVVGMTKEQATAMKTASAGEDALTEDKSASKQLLQAIMNAINGGDAKVGGKYKDLNSVTIVDDISNSFGMEDSGQIIASYNGATLYKAVYPKCRDAVADDCNSASLQRAVNAYLMAIEQDCNTVSTALKNQQKTLKGAVHQSSAMLDLARVENHQKHNADDIATCLVNVEKAIQSEEVCGAKYHKCLDYGQFIDVSTGAPLTGVSDFYKLGEILSFKTDKDIKDQKLSMLSNNRTFVNFFENKTKKFAKDALDKCADQSDAVWQEYLDRALLDIYYAQKDKVKEIEDSCFSLVAACYDNQSTSITNAMANLTGDYSLLLKPAVISLTTTMCSDYIDSCNRLFGDDDIIKKYVANKDKADSETACRAIAQQCFDKFGGVGYENFYYPASGLFKSGAALDWFTLKSTTTIKNEEGNITGAQTSILSPCAQELKNTEGCADSLETVFGGFDKIVDGDTVKYTYNSSEDRSIRPRGVATEIYYKIIDNLATQCESMDGFFVEYKYAPQYNYNPDNLCLLDTDAPQSVFYNKNLSATSLHYWYHFLDSEDVCPASYDAKVDTQSWGICSCWENGGYRSKNGTSATCLPVLLAAVDNEEGNSDPECTTTSLKEGNSSELSGWCQQTITSSYGQICPTTKSTLDGDTKIVCDFDNPDVKKAITEKVPHHKVAIEY